MTEPQVDPRHYGWAGYVTQGRWINYWHQLQLALEASARSALVVGVGDTLVAEVLAREGLHVCTLDLDPELRPTVVADVRRLPFRPKSFDVVLCCQVLEHLPFHDLSPAITTLRALAGRRLVVSLPQRGRAWSLSVRVPRVGAWSRGGVLPARTAHVFDGQHHWEMGAPGLRRRHIDRATGGQLSEARTFVDPSDPYRRFFVWP